MPRSYMFTKEQVLDAAIELTREKGFSAVSARSLGDRLGTTSRPIFSHFENMADVQKGIIGAANKIYQSFREEEIKSGRYVPYKASGMAYIRFAKEEKELFKLLFMRDRSGEQIKENPEEMEALIGLIAKQVNIDKEAARFFYLEMWAYTHGIASMIATGFYEWDEQLASRALTDVYEGLKHRYRDASVCVRGGSSATEYQTAHVYRLGAFQLVRKRLDALPLQLHNHTDSDWCLCIGRFSVLPLLLRQFQEAPAPSKAGKNDTGK